MLKKSTLVLFLALASFFSKAQQGWFKQKINSKVTVGFPSEPKKVNENSYVVKDADENVYVITTLDMLAVTKMSSEEFNTGIVTQDFADEFLSGLAPSMPAYTFKDIKIAKIKDQVVYQIEGRDDKNQATIFFNIFFIDGTSYSLACIQKDGKPTRTKDLFLTNMYISK